MQDFNYEMMDGSWIHLEFESDSLKAEDLRRFRTYEAMISQHYRVPVTTCVLCSSTVKRLKYQLTEGINVYQVKVIRLKDKDATRIIRRLEKKQKKSRLERVDLLKLLLTPLMGGEMPQEERINRGMLLLRQEREHLSQEEQMQMEAVLYTLALKFLTKADLKKIKEMMNMTVLGEMILQDGIEKGLKKGIKEGIQAGKEQINRLNQRLIDENRLDDLKRAAVDKDFQNQLLIELFPEEL